MNIDDLRRYRKQFKMTQKDLARELCVSYWTVVSWETNKREIPFCCQKLFCILHGIDFKEPENISENVDQMNFEF